MDKVFEFDTRRPRKIYVASSWRTSTHGFVVKTLREAGHEVFDYRNPPHGRFDEHNPWFKGVEKPLEHPMSDVAFDGDAYGLMWCDTLVLVLPSGRSAHTEFGYVIGEGKDAFIIKPYDEPSELMYRLIPRSHETENLQQLLEVMG